MLYTISYNYILYTTYYAINCLLETVFFQLSTVSSTSTVSTLYYMLYTIYYIQRVDVLYTTYILYTIYILILHTTTLHTYYILTLHTILHTYTAYYLLIQYSASGRKCWHTCFFFFKKFLQKKNSILQHSCPWQFVRRCSSWGETETGWHSVCGELYTIYYILYTIYYILYTIY